MSCNTGESQHLALSDDEILERARAILSRRMKRDAPVLDTPARVGEYLAMHYAELQYEIFGILWLDAQNRFIENDQMFRGTLTQTSVYPREVVKSALRSNAASGILYHNHPSGCSEPSASDRTLTRTLRDALALIDVRVLDHFIVAGAGAPTSFSELGML